jgi:hypothetical protein
MDAAAAAHEDAVTNAVARLRELATRREAEAAARRAAAAPAAPRPAPGQRPSGPRRPGEGVEDEDQGIIAAEATPTGGARLCVTLLAAGFIIGPAGASVKALAAATGTHVRSWNGAVAVGGRARRVRTLVVEGPPGAVVAALAILDAAVARYKELCGGAHAGRPADRVQRVRGVPFFYAPPPRGAVPLAAPLRARGGAGGAAAEPPSPVAAEPAPQPERPRAAAPPAPAPAAAAKGRLPALVLAAAAPGSPAGAGLPSPAGVLSPAARWSPSGASTPGAPSPLRLCGAADAGARADGALGSPPLAAPAFDSPPPPAAGDGLFASLGAAGFSLAADVVAAELGRGLGLGLASPPPAAPAWPAGADADAAMAALCMPTFGEFAMRASAAARAAFMAPLAPPAPTTGACAAAALAGEAEALLREAAAPGADCSAAAAAAAEAEAWHRAFAAAASAAAAAAPPPPYFY